MSISNLLSRKKEDKASLSIVLFKEGVYLCQSKQADAPSFFQIKNNDWKLTLSEALEKLELKELTANVTLGSHHYHTYQIDKPVIPEEEWPEALPFLVKDLISERVADVIVSGVNLPHVPKAQTYVMPKAILFDIQEIFKAREIKLLQILPEDSVWGMTQPNNKPFMLLHSTGSEEFKMGAFFQGTAIFQRSIRDVRSPITGATKDSMQLDNLALEIQRSMDFLSSQLKQTQINNLFLCCDNDDVGELKTELHDRLNVNVNPLSEEGSKLKSGNVLAIEALKLEEQPSNIYAPYLRPKEDGFNFNLIIILWLLTAIILGAAYAFLAYKDAELEETSKNTTRESQQIAKTVTEMETKLEQRQLSPVKLQKIENLQDKIQSQRNAIRAIERFDDKELEGYSSAMSNLSMLAGSDISLSGIRIQSDQMDLKGITRTAQDVPKWIQEFKTEDSLKGRLFSGMAISLDEDDNIIFSLHSTKGDEKK